MAAPSPGEPQAALAAQVADLRGMVLTMKARLDHAGMKGGIKLHEQVAELARQVEALSGDSGPAPKVTAPVWAGLTPEEHAAQLEDLAGWVDGFLRVHYPHVPLRPCWSGHLPAVWELSTLQAEWQRVYCRKSPELAGALTWHDRWLPGVIVRLETILADCGRGGCALATSPAPAQAQAR